jgi:biotin carboxylase
MIKPSVLVLGGTKFQIPAIEKAKLMGFNTITVDKNPECQARQVTDQFEPIDLIDVPRLVKFAVEKSIIGAITLQSDIGVRAIGAINDELGLTGISYQTALNCTDKTVMRICLEKSEINQPNFSVVSDLHSAMVAAERIGFPVIVKSPNNSGSRGVYRIENELDLKKLLAHERVFLKNDFIIEKYLTGIEFGAQGFFSKDKLIFLAIHNDKMDKINGTIPIGHSFPFKSPSLVSRIWDFSEMVARALLISDGPCNFDFMLVGEDIFVIEVGARIGATGLPEIVKLFYGVDLIELNLQMFFGSLNVSESFGMKGVACEIIEAPTNGKLLGYYDLGHLMESNNFIDWSLDRKVGDLIRPLENGADRVGIVFSSGSDAVEAENNSEIYAKEIADLLIIGRDN